MVLVMKKTFTEEEVKSAIWAEVNKSSLRKTAVRSGFSAAFLSDILRGNRGVSENVAKAFGFEREIITEVVFRKIA